MFSELHVDSGTSKQMISSPNHYPEWDSAPDKFLVSDSGTYLAYFKCFVGAGVLFLPHAFHSAGLTTALLTFVVTTILSTVCMLKMVEAKNRVVEDFKYGITHGVAKTHEVVSFGMLGHVAMGPLGRTIVDTSIAVSQLCFATAYLIFCSKNLHNIYYQLGNCHESYFVSSSSIIWLLVPCLIPLMFIRQLSKFGLTILIADVLIVFGLVYLAYRSMAVIVERGGQFGAGIVQFNPVGFWRFLGTALYALEGTAFVIPIEHTMQNKQHFVRITTFSGLAIGAMYMLFGLVGYLAFGSSTEAILTLNLKRLNPNDKIVVFMQLGYCVALFLSFPFAMFPFMRILEPKLFPTSSHLSPSSSPLQSSSLSKEVLKEFKSDNDDADVTDLLISESSSPSNLTITSPICKSHSAVRRDAPRASSSLGATSPNDIMWQQNAIRALMTVLSGLIAAVGGSSFDNYIALVGGLMCVPLTLIYPAYFHLKICGDRLSACQKWEDYVCLIVGIVGSISCTIVSIWQWINQGQHAERSECMRLS